MSNTKLLDPRLERILRLASQRLSRAEIARRIGWTAPKLKRYLDACGMTARVDALARHRARLRRPNKIEREGLHFLRGCGYRIGRSRITGGWTCEGLEVSFHTCGRRRDLPTMGPVYCLEIYAAKKIKAVRWATGHWTVHRPLLRNHETITLPIKEIPNRVPPKVSTVRRWVARLEGFEVKEAKTRLAHAKMDHRSARWAVGRLR